MTQVFFPRFLILLIPITNPVMETMNIEVLSLIKLFVPDVNEIHHTYKQLRSIGLEPKNMVIDRCTCLDYFRLKDKWMEEEKKETEKKSIQRSEFLS
ncbi:MAG: hypothetical protein ACW97X_14355 [Candidatus Hodarchaeales archaeon]|jgi:hypothetical protein